MLLEKQRDHVLVAFGCRQVQRGATVVVAGVKVDVGVSVQDLVQRRHVSGRRGVHDAQLQSLTPAAGRDGRVDLFRVEARGREVMKAEFFHESLGKRNALDRVPKVVDRRRPHADASDVGHDNHDDSAHP